MREVLLTTSLNVSIKKKKLSEKLGEDMIDYLKTYKKACVDYELSEAKVQHYMYNFLDGELKRIYRENFVPTVGKYAQTKAF